MTAEQQLTIREAYVEASSFLLGHQVQEAANCADLLLQHVLGYTRSELLLRWQEMFPVEQLELWQELLERKASGEPVQYIIGEQEFYGLPFTVNPAVLIPRPETELLVEQVVLLGKQLWPGAEAESRASGAGAESLEVTSGANESGEAGLEARRATDQSGIGQDCGEPEQEREAGVGPLIADIGAGSGAIAVSLAMQCPRWCIVSSDISPAALAVAEANAERHGVSERVTFIEGDLLMPYIERGLRLDAVVSNPPYIPEADEAGLQPEVRLHEPRTALYGGADGLVLYRRLAAQLKELAVMPALVGLEVGLGQAQAVAKLLSDVAEWDEVRIVPDLAGIERHVIAVRYSK
ncbi:HemK family protein methyltransferase [Paenibacillus sp. LMG 31456]|uniref:Release factor glutamine methyltransferase n=1 Tax=Paenibacillus foliorum TaxID=2654974 RepID=A0A972GQN1_9BACL|nr:HemK/PrmC family methyltransferase [Paenibacillus foliorum]NOU95022.1 HemK family protein methyltransferase [Paenibacillus foliorum]